MAAVAKGPLGPEAAEGICKRIRHAVQPFVGAVAESFPNEGSMERLRTQGGRGPLVVAASEGERGTGKSCFAS